MFSLNIPWHLTIEAELVGTKILVLLKLLFWSRENHIQIVHHSKDDFKIYRKNNIKHKFRSLSNVFFFWSYLCDRYNPNTLWRIAKQYSGYLNQFYICIKYKHSYVLAYRNFLSNTYAIIFFSCGVYINVVEGKCDNIKLQLFLLQSMLFCRFSASQKILEFQRVGWTKRKCVVVVWLCVWLFCDEIRPNFWQIDVCLREEKFQKRPA